MKATHLHGRPALPKGVLHPIETTNYVVTTPAIDEMCALLIRWLRARITGGMIVGPQRLGKSRATEYASLEADQHFPGIPVRTFLCPPYRLVAEETFLEEVLEDIGHTVIESGHCRVKKKRVVEFVQLNAVSSQTNQFLLFVDDAHNLHEHHFSLLAYFQERLRRRQVNLTVVLVGQPELFEQRDVFMHSRKRQIVGRFMAHCAPFHGIRTVKEMRSCLESYDEHSEFPEGSGCSFTAFHFPEAFAAGWRLAHSTEELWAAFKRAQRAALVKEVQELEMEYFTLTVEFVLKAADKIDPGKSGLPDDLLDVAIQESAYPGFLRGLRPSSKGKSST